MPLTPQSSMPTPWWFLRQSATVTTRSSTQETAGSYELTAGTTYTVLSCLQPNSSTDGQIYKRETGNSLFTLYLAPTTTTGASIASVVNHISTITIESVVYQVNGEVVDLCSNGAVYQLSVFKES